VASTRAPKESAKIQAKRSNDKEAEMRDETRMLLESMGRLFEDHCTKAITDAAEAGTFPAALWQAISESGVPLGGVIDSDVDWSDL
jgi:hypothetical protein